MPYPLERLPSLPTLTLCRHLVTTQRHINLLQLLEAFAVLFPGFTEMACFQFPDVIEHELADL